MLKIGTAAPPFVAEDQDGRTVELGTLHGSWVILYFYPRDDTPGCTTEAIEFTARIKEFERLGARVLGLSPDPPDRHARFCEKHKLGIRLLSDPTHKVLKAYGAWGMKEMAGKNSEGVLRSTVLIDPKGSVRHQWLKVKAAGHAQEVLEKLKGFLPR